MSRGRNRLIAGLRDALALDDVTIALLEFLSRNSLGHFHAVALRASFHMLEGRAQSARLKECLGLLGAKAATALCPVPRSTLVSPVDDDLVSAVLELYGLAHHAIALYRYLVTLAEMERKADVADLCRVSLAEKVRMATWFERQLDDLASPAMESRRPGSVDGRLAPRASI